MNVKRTVGIGLLWIGFLSGSLAAVQEPDIDATESAMQQNWRTINWWWYGGSLAVAGVGIALIWQTRKPTARQTFSFAKQLENQRSAIQSLQRSLAELKENLDSWAPSEIRDFIDEQCSPPLADFADARSAITHRHGLVHFADLMTDFALCERYINRAWSAAADGYLDEVGSCLEIVQVKLESLAEKFQRLNPADS